MSVSALPLSREQSCFAEGGALSARVPLHHSLGPFSLTAVNITLSAVQTLDIQLKCTVPDYCGAIGTVTFFFFFNPAVKCIQIVSAILKTMMQWS